MIEPAAAGSASGRLLDGPPRALGAETLEAHIARLGPRPPGGPWLVDVLEQAGLRGRGGAWFPTARKWRPVMEAGGPALVVVNASEGEPLSAKDRTLVALRPHLVLDGAALAAETLGADEVVVYLSRPFTEAAHAVRRAARDRARAGRREPAVRVVSTRHRYVAGEASAVVRRLNGGPARPAFSPRHPAGHRVGGRATLVQNAETLAHAALIARRGAAWFRERGTAASPGTALVTLSGAIGRPGVHEADLAATVGEVVAAAGGHSAEPAAALVGGYFGTWVAAGDLPGLPLDRAALGARGASLGCGVLALLPVGACGVAEAARIVAWLAAESAGQCGPCVFGLRAIAATMERIAASRAVPTDVDRVRRWGASVRGRGACNHPDGAVHHVESALETFAGHLDAHLAGIPCPASRHPALHQPASPRRWRR